jgi:predicted SAM-dependent methyltransferase
MSVKQRVGRWLIPKLPLSRFAFDVLRLELNTRRVHALNRLLPWRILRLSRLRRETGIYANIASAGFLLEGFVHLDLFPGNSPSVVPWDCSRGLPFSDASCRGLRIEHFLEHIDPRHDVPRLLLDCYRVLSPGGVLRVIVPDAEQFVRAYSQADVSSFEKLGWGQPFPTDLPLRMDVVSHIFHQGHEHRWAYDFENLSDRLANAGFSQISKLSYGNSLDARLAQDRLQHAPYSLYVDARKIVCAADRCARGPE